MYKYVSVKKCILFILQDSLPSVLYLQMDNTCRDNKNKYTLTFAALLVQLNIFRKVTMLVTKQDILSN